VTPRSLPEAMLSLLFLPLFLGACGDTGKEDDSAVPCLATAESCDGVDNDCDGEIDEGLPGLKAFYVDADEDGWGSDTTRVIACAAPEGYVADGGDCDDANASVNPGVAESCDGLDDDCDGEIDEAGAIGAVDSYADADTDGYGDPATLITSCDYPLGRVPDGSDCNDADATIHPDAPELPDDGIDQNCDGLDACSDLNCDGWPDLVACAYFGEDLGCTTESDVFYSEKGTFPLDAAHTLKLPSESCHGVAAEDLDRDGFKDVVIVNSYWSNSGAHGSTTTHPVIWWGSATGLDGSTTELDVPMATTVTVHDLDGNGWPDLVFPVQRYEKMDSAATILYGSPDGFSKSASTRLAIGSSYEAIVDDFDKDGIDDLFFAVDVADGTFGTGSELLWGSTAGYALSDDTLFPNERVFDAAVADLDNDGWDDVILANWAASVTSAVDVHSTLFWGGADGFDPENATELDTLGAWSVEVADLDGNGFLDLAFACGAATSEEELPSIVYWGSSLGFDTIGRTGLATHQAHDLAIADLDQDGWLDLVVANQGEMDEFWMANSAIYWGSATGLSDENRTDLPTAGAWGVTLADLDLDGWTDVLFADATVYADGSTPVTEAILYRNLAGTFDPATAQVLPLSGGPRIPILVVGGGA
jgi:hypothetical protein